MASTTTTAAAMAVIDPLDQQEMRDIIAETAEEDRGRLMTICNDIIPNQIIFKDRVILVTILSKTGNMDIHDEGLNVDRINEDGCISGNTWNCSVDNDGRIIELHIWNTHYEQTGFVLPPIIIRLEMLQNLMVANCRSLPAELSKLQHLQTLYLTRCCELVLNFPVQMELRNLKYFRLTLTRIPESTSSPFFVWLTTKLPNLHDLHFLCLYGGEIRPLFMTVNEKRFQDNLLTICMGFCSFEEEPTPVVTRFDTIISKIHPRFPNLRSIQLDYNGIESIQPIVEKFETEQKVPSSLRVLSLYVNPVLKNIKDDPKERAAAMSLLKICNTIYSLGGRIKEDYPSDIEYELRINHAGRNAVAVNDDRPIPISLWPTILERAYENSHQIYEYNSEKKEKDATGLYYLLREGPALIGRPELGSGPAGDQSLLSSMLLSSISSSRKRRRIQTEIPLDLFNKCTPQFRDAWTKETQANKIDILGCKLLDSKKPPA
jgi:hypothetical protein